jgi:carbon monoxide dehydrogenase subunit G
MLEAHGGVVINAPASEVFDYLADARNEPDWLPGASDVQLSSEEPVGRGSTFVGTYARAGSVQITLTRYDRPTAITFHGEAKGMSFDDEIQLTDVEGATKLAAVIRTQPKGLFRLVAPMMGRVISGQFQANWDRLREKLESRQ